MPYKSNSAPRLAHVPDQTKKDGSRLVYGYYRGLLFFLTIVWIIVKIPSNRLVYTVTVVSATREPRETRVFRAKEK